MEDFAGVAKSLEVSKNQKSQQQLKILILRPKVAQNVVRVWYYGMDDMAHSLVVQNTHTVEEQETAVDKYQNWWCGGQ